MDARGGKDNNYGNNDNNKNDSDGDLASHPRPSSDTMLEKIEGSNLKPIKQCRTNTCN